MSHQPPHWQQPPAQPPHDRSGDAGAPSAHRPSPAKTLVWLIGGVLAIAAIGIPFFELVYKPVLVELASAVTREAGRLGQRPTDWSSAALTTFAILTAVQIMVPCTAYLLTVAGITRQRRRATTIAMVATAAFLGVLSVMMAAIHPRVNPGLGPRTERFADRFDVSAPDVLAVLWQTARGPQVMLMCCGALAVVLAMTTWWNRRSPRRPRAAWPWVLPLPAIVLVAAGGQLGGSLTVFPA